MTEAPPTNPLPPQPPATGVSFSRPMIVALLYLLNVVLSFSVFVGLVLAYIWRGDRQTQEWEESHFTYLIRTFWIGLLLFAVSIALFFGNFFSNLPPEGAQGEAPPAAFFVLFFGTIIVWLAMAAWYCARCIISMVKASNQQPIPMPETWLF